MDLAILALAGGGLSLVAAVLFFQPLLIGFAALCFLLALLFWKYGEVLVPTFTKAFGVSQKFGEVELVPERDVLLLKRNNGYTALKFLRISFYGASQDVEAFRRALMNFPCDVRISLLVRSLDLSSVLERLRERRSLLETKLAEVTDEAERRLLERKLEYVNGLLSRLGAGERPLEVFAYAVVYSSAPGKAEVLRKVRENSSSVKALLSSSLGCEVRELVDRSLLEVVKKESFGLIECG